VWGDVPKKKRRRKPATHPRHQQPAHHTSAPIRSSHPDDDGDDPLTADVRRLLQDDGPLGLLQLASGLLSVLDERADLSFPGPAAGLPDLSLAELVTAFVEIRRRETTALLSVLSHLVGDDLLARRIRRELSARHDSMPDWLTQLEPLTVRRAVLMTDVLGDGENVTLAVRTGAGDDLTVVAYIDHNLGTVVKDAFAVPAPIEDILDMAEQAAAGGPALVLVDLDPADARARITEAVEKGASAVPPLETDTWPMTRPLVEWVVGHLPEGGTGHARPEWDREARQALEDEFARSDHAADLSEKDRRLAGTLIRFTGDHGPGDPLRWSPVAVEILLLDWLPAHVTSAPDDIARLPEVLRRFIRFCHARTGIAADRTQETLESVDRHEPALRAAVAASEAGPTGFTLPYGHELLGLPREIQAQLTAHVHGVLVEAVGQEDLAELDDTPLPDEPLDLSRVPEDAHRAVEAVADRIAAGCADLLDDEYRTAGLRLLADIAAADPAIFRGRARADTSAATVLWIALKVNGDAHRYGRCTVQELGDWYGVSSPSRRASRFLAALGRTEQYLYDVQLGTPRYLVSDSRRELVQVRELYGL